MPTESPIAQRWEVLHETLDERQRRLLVGVEAKVLGRGGISAVAAATGVSRVTIMAGISEIEAMKSADLAEDSTTAPKVQGTRQAGGGRKKIETKDETLLPDLLALLEPSTRGDPESPLRWTCKSLRNLADEL
ncbi:MAG: ISAzo13 family transposase, partial [Comamonadaceae bacterium CG_4_9_14_0_8_um_filter_60_18]